MSRTLPRGNNKDRAIVFLALVGVLAFICVCAVIHAKMEAAAFNRVTGKNVSWQDAFFLELRVDGG